jgi:hypothetical protein
VSATWIQLLAALLSGSILPSIGKWFWRLFTRAGERELSRVESLEALVEVLRRALDKIRLREDALAQVLGVLIFGLKSIENISPPVADAIERAIGILEGVQAHLEHISSAGQQ